MGLVTQYVFDRRRQHLTVLDRTTCTTHRLGRPPSTDLFPVMADFMVHMELGYYLKPDVVDEVARHLQKDVDRCTDIVCIWEAHVFRELLESVRLTLGYSDLRFAERFHGFPE